MRISNPNLNNKLYFALERRSCPLFASSLPLILLLPKEKIERPWWRGKQCGIARRPNSFQMLDSSPCSTSFESLPLRHLFYSGLMDTSALHGLRSSHSWPIQYPRLDWLVVACRGPFRPTTSLPLSFFSFPPALIPYSFDVSLGLPLQWKLIGHDYCSAALLV